MALRNPIARPLAQIVSRVGALGWTLRGSRRLRRGDARGAIRAYEAALRRRPGHFRGLMHLAVAHLCAREVPEARRFLADARDGHPRLYEREAASLLSRGGFDLEAIHRLGALPRRSESAVTALSQLRARGLPVEAGDELRGDESRDSAAETSRESADLLLPYGDCADIDEYTRFSAMPPIHLTEGEGVDWDAVFPDEFPAS